MLGMFSGTNTLASVDGPSGDMVTDIGTTGSGVIEVPATPSSTIGVLSAT
jgi:hypothetical protein